MIIDFDELLSAREADWFDVWEATGTPVDTLLEVVYGHTGEYNGDCVRALGEYFDLPFVDVIDTVTSYAIEYDLKIPMTSVMAVSTVCGCGKEDAEDMIIQAYMLDVNLAEQRGMEIDKRTKTVGLCGDEPRYDVKRIATPKFIRKRKEKIPNKMI